MLSLSRLAYDMESLISPLLATLLLAATSYHSLFLGTVLGFSCSAVLVSVTEFPESMAPGNTKFFHRFTGGVQAFWARPELRSLKALNLVVAATTAMVIVNTVVLVQGGHGRSQTHSALLLGAYGAGSMMVALTVPGLLDRFPDRRVMLCGADCLPLLLLAASGTIHWGRGTSQWIALMATWLLIGAAIATILTPSSWLLRRNSTEQNRPGIFAAQISLSHACFLITYPLAGATGAVLGLAETALVLVTIGLLGSVLAVFSWRSGIEPCTLDASTGIS
ncbi:hypothetical protein [Glutamicibacter sp. FBE19]|uniref:hypothetical protein n=1 Tax=Glutamicibacter sp. FBE19 TaxID=2761534 RepID=UPI001FD28FA8|nr:hypothetical protein [Glutamicibacter sp. FBE19]